MAGADVMRKVTAELNDDRSEITYTVVMDLDGLGVLTTHTFVHDVEEGTEPAFTLVTDLLGEGWEFDPPLVEE